MLILLWTLERIAVFFFSLYNPFVLLRRWRWQELKLNSTHICSFMRNNFWTSTKTHPEYYNKNVDLFFFSYYIVMQNMSFRLWFLIKKWKYRTKKLKCSEMHIKHDFVQYKEGYGFASFLLHFFESHARLKSTQHSSVRNWIMNFDCIHATTSIFKLP